MSNRPYSKFSNNLRTRVDKNISTINSALSNNNKLNALNTGALIKASGTLRGVAFKQRQSFEKEYKNLYKVTGKTVNAPKNVPFSRMNDEINKAKKNVENFRQQAERNAKAKKNKELANIRAKKIEELKKLKSQLNGLKRQVNGRSPNSN